MQIKGFSGPTLISTQLKHNQDMNAQRPSPWLVQCLWATITPAQPCYWDAAFPTSLAALRAGPGPRPLLRPQHMYTKPPPSPQALLSVLFTLLPLPASGPMPASLLSSCLCFFL